MKHAPMLYVWGRGCFTPHPYFRSRAAEQFVDGQLYRLERVEDRSMNSHRRYFALIKEAWDNLREQDDNRWRTPDELRYWALCHTSFRTTREYKAASKAEVRRIEKFLASDPDYCVVEIVDNKTVLQHKPESQSRLSMSGRRFQQSQKAVLEVIATKLGVEVEELESNARSAA